MSLLRTALMEGSTQVGLCVMYPSPGVVERIGQDWDFIWIDGQHGEMGYHDLLALVRACDFVRRPSLVRVPWHETGPIGQALDMGATGVIVPCVDTAEQAQAAVRAARFPPLGGRSYGGRRPIDLRGRGYAATANEDTLLIVQIESPEAVRNADAIAAVPGVDALFLGPDDLFLRLGHNVETAPRNRGTMGADLDAVVRACRAHGKFGMTVGVGAAMFTLMRDAGFQLIVAGSDVAFLGNGSRQSAAEARALLAGSAKPAAAPAAQPPTPY
jgi:4-hydroxy-2-oxoheptanedioate aldolase